MQISDIVLFGTTCVVVVFSITNACFCNRFAKTAVNTILHFAVSPYIHTQTARLN